jgi:hypothetical protein
LQLLSIFSSAVGLFMPGQMNADNEALLLLDSAFSVHLDSLQYPEFDDGINRTTYVRGARPKTWSGPGPIRQGRCDAQLSNEIDFINMSTFFNQ